jgi:SHS2 domain-containing protein
LYRWVEHTGELELEIAAATEQGVFEEGFAAMRELLGCEPHGEAEPHEIDLAARDRASLLADWLGELAFLAEAERFVPRRLVSLSFAENRLRARIDGFRGSPPHLVKAATYHRLGLRPGEAGWTATVVLDV